MKINQLLKIFGLQDKNPIDVDAVNAYVKRVCALPFDEARRRAYATLEGNPAYELDPANPNEPVPEEVSAGLADLFSRYRSVEWEGLARVSLEDWLKCADIPDSYFIGEDAESPMVIRSKQEPIYFYYGNKITDEYPSIFHWLLALNDDAFSSGSDYKST